MSNGYTSKCSGHAIFWCSVHTGLSTAVLECQKIGKGGLDHYGAQCFGRLIFGTIRKSVELKGLKQTQVT